MFDSTPWLGSGFLELLALCFLAVLAVATLVVWVVDRVHRRAQRVAQRAVELGAGLDAEVDRLLDDGRVLADDGWVLHDPVSRVVSASCPLRVLPHRYGHESLTGGRHRRGEQVPDTPASEDLTPTE